MRKKLIIILMLAGAFSLRVDAIQKETPVQKAGSDSSVAKRKNPEERAESLANRLKDKLELKDNQITELKNIFMEREKALDSFWEQVRKSEEQMMAEMQKVLTPEQMEKFREIYKRQVPQAPMTPMSPMKRDSLQSAPHPGNK